MTCQECTDLDSTSRFNYEYNIQAWKHQQSDGADHGWIMCLMMDHRIHVYVRWKGINVVIDSYNGRVVFSFSCDMIPSG